MRFCTFMAGTYDAVYELPDARRLLRLTTCR